MDEPPRPASPAPEEPVRPVWLDEPASTASVAAGPTIDDWSVSTTAPFPAFEAPAPPGWGPSVPPRPTVAPAAAGGRAGGLRAAVAGAVVGAVVAAAVAGGIVAASNDDHVRPAAVA